MPSNKVSVLLNGGLDEQAFPELAGPIASQGASITLRESNNTRLSTHRGTCTRAPSVAQTASNYAAIHGVVSCAAGRNSVVFARQGEPRSFVLASDGTYSSPGAGGLLSPINGAAQNAYLPCQITNAGAIPSVSAVAPPATCYDPTNQWYWTAYYGLVADGSPDLRVYVAISDADGGVVCPPSVVGTIAGGTNGWLGITAHGSLGVRLWVQFANSIYWATLVRTQTRVSYDGAGLSHLAVTSLTDDTAAAVVSGMLLDENGAVDATHQTYAYLVSSAPLFPNNGQLTRVDISSGATVVDVFIAALTGDGSASVCFSKIAGNYRVGVGFHATTLNRTTMAILNTGASRLNFDDTIDAADRVRDCAVQFLQGTDNRLVMVTSVVDGTFSNPIALIPTGCQFWSMVVGTSTMVQDALVPWMALRSHGTALRFSATEQYPLFDLVPYYGVLNETPVDGDYVLDPSIVLYLVGDQNLYSPVARYGCVRGNIAAAQVALAVALPHGLTTVGTKVHATYLKDIVGSSGQEDYPARFVEIDFAPFQPPVAHDKDGVAMIAAALPAQWDGVEVVELGGPLFAPKLRVEEAGGSGPAYPAGDYSMSVYFSWTDAGGLEHRTAPAGELHTSVGGSPQIYATTPTSLRNGVRQVLPDLLLFASAVGPGATQHLLPERGYNTLGVLLTVGDPSLPDVSRQNLYSSGTAGEPQTPQPPPPAQDICIIGDRCWIIDQEIRSRVVHSKKRISGRGFEFHPAYEILLPSGSGKAVAIREWQGSAIVFCEFAIFQISGDGPDNLVGNRSGGSFSKPQQLATVGCANRESVLVTPKGILFQRDDDVMLFTGGEPQAIPGIQPATEITGAVLLRDYDEAVLLIAGEAKVWNYSLNRWSTWDLANLTYAHTLCYQPNQALFATATATPTIHLLDSDVEGDTEMSWATDWVVLGGDFQDSVTVEEVIYSARRESTHGCSVDVYTQYDESGTFGWTGRDFTAAEITALAGTIGRYTLHVHPQRQDTKAVKVRITETETGEIRTGMRPICLTFKFKVTGQVHENSRIQGSNK